MDRLIRLALASMALSASILYLAPVCAEDMPTCPDLPARQAVLDQGNRIYNHEGASHNFYADLPETKMHTIEDNQILGPLRDAPQLNDPPTETKTDLERLPLDSPRDAVNALRKAEKLELYKQPALARILYSRLLPMVKIPISDKHYDTRIWEGYARTVLLLPFDPMSSQELPFHSAAAALRYLQSKRQEETNCFAVVAAVNQVVSKSDLQAVEAACNSALQARNVLDGNRSAVIANLMILGALAERDKRINEAFAYYLPAFQLEHYTINIPIRLDKTLPAVAPALQGILSAIQQIDGTDEQLLSYLSEFDELLSRSPDIKPDLDMVKEKTNRLVAFHKKQIRIRPCMEMAANLNTTAFNLEKTDHFDMAWKLYHEALEIKQINLGPAHIETTRQLVDLARVAAEQKRFTLSKEMYEKALAAMRKNPQADSTDIVTVLESYAQMMVSLNETAKAKKLYDEARAVALNAGKYRHGLTR